MNAAVRAVTRTAINAGAEVFAIYEGYQGMVDGGDGIRPFGWGSVSNILHRGGTEIGTFRSDDFRKKAGRKQAAKNLLENGIDRLVVIGGDGSLTGLSCFSEEWPELVKELAAEGEVTAKVAKAHPVLYYAGLVGSIDNDLVGTDMTIGADTALHRIIEAIDALSSTAASHQRAFVIEVMGRHCGYLALMSAIAGGCDYVLIPENPPLPGWEKEMCAKLHEGRLAGRRDSMVVVAEGATDRKGKPITAEYIRKTIEDSLGEDTRVTILGHVQRGGTPSAYDRWASTWLGYEAALAVLSDDPELNGAVFGFRENRVSRIGLHESVETTRSIPKLIAAGDYDEAMRLRGGSFSELARMFDQIATPAPTEAPADAKRVGILHAGGLAPGMNAAARAAVRLAVARGMVPVGIHDGFAGLRDGKVTDLPWDEVEGWLDDGGAVLGLRRNVPEPDELYAIARNIEENQLAALLVIGGWNAYMAAHLCYRERDHFPSLKIPIICLPASIDNNLPGSELSIGADTALNTVVEAIDRIKGSGAASTRAFIIETMGQNCGYLALMGGLATGAEKVYLAEEGITIDELRDDAAYLKRSFAAGRELFVAIRNEMANLKYTTDFIARIFDQESDGAYDVRTNILGHIQQGGSPSPFDRLLATRLVSRALEDIAEQFAAGTCEAKYLGLVGGRIQTGLLSQMREAIDPKARRPREQWWLALRPVNEAVSHREY
jgi:6-phosphofructokinase 1